MKICICDDDNYIHEQIRSQINSIFVCENVPEIVNFHSGEELINNLEKGHFFDIVFMDIEMEQISGLKAAEILRKSTPKVIIIFISNYPNYVFDAFKVEALHFLLKPISPPEFQNVFSRALNKYKTANSTISLKWQNERYIIKVDTIKYIEGYKRHITVYTQDETYEAIGKIPDLLTELSPHGFIRTHQGFLVNMDYIKRFDATDVVLFDGTKVMISVRKRAEALQQFDKYLKSKKW